MTPRVYAPRVYAFHKPRGSLSSTVSEAGAPTVHALLPEPYRTFFAVGRLDKDSEGLLLFTSDSRFAQRLMDPGGVSKTYVVTVVGFPRDDDLASIRAGGLVIDGQASRPAEVTRLGKAPRSGTRFQVTLHEGRNRQIRRLFRAAGFEVRRLVRIAVGPIGLRDLPEGGGRELSPSEVRQLQAEA